ncbi:hypothetical protein [Rhizobium sp. PP-F2F-G48]|uniref:hypothetical protein n=1 Tax=Rhizobium sp. PP-F2F-G48 TaxID=2135651 RepID=UPI001FDF9915|nr:hypothetical protein [Rhizobium sp. PP-F2F-G48]
MRSPEAVRDESAYQEAPPHPAPAACDGVMDVKVAPKATHADSATLASFRLVNQVPLRRIVLLFSERDGLSGAKMAKKSFNR